MTNTAPQIPDQLANLVDQARQLEKWPIARLVSLFESDSLQAAQDRERVMGYLQYVELEPEGYSSSQGTILGITGTPGAGKSSLIGKLCLHLLEAVPELTIAVVAIDPSSQNSGGALLGDRTRTQFPINEKRLYFRSQASALDLGGMGRKTFQVVRLLRRIFDLVIIETVGIGQSEIEVDRLSDHTLLVMQPLAGDQVQFMKAGIMEVPDTFVINKCDEDTLATRSYHLLKSSLKLANIYVNEGDRQAAPIFLTSATKQRGITELAEHILGVMKYQSVKNFEPAEITFLKKWVKEEYGNYGLALADSVFTLKADERFCFETRMKQLQKLFETCLPAPEMIDRTVINE